MRIAIVRPGEHRLAHRVRGTGFYIRNLEESLKRFDKNNVYLSCDANNIPREVDIVHFPYFEPFFLTLPFFEKRKVVVTVHDLIPFVFPKNFPTGVKGKLRWKIQKRLLKKAKAVITDSRNSKADILKFVGLNESSVHSIYLAAGDQFRELNDAMGESVKRKFTLPEKFVLYVGDVTWNKNLPRLIEAVKSLGLPLVLVGKALVDKNFDKSNPWNRDLARVIELSEKDKKIIRLGFVEDKDLVALYNVATVFAMPSVYEGFGLPILEAMASGCPVVTSKGGSITEIAGNAPIYIDPYSIKDIAGGIKKVYYSENIREELRRSGFSQAKKFSWEKTAKETIKVYESI